MRERETSDDMGDEPTGQDSHWSGAALAFFGGLLTLLVGGSCLLFTQSMVLHELGLYGWAPFDFLDLLCGMWIVLPATYAGYTLGFDQTLVWLSHFWFTADPRRPAFSGQLWAGLILTCMVSGQIVKALP